jgi:hypothetical protein
VWYSTAHRLVFFVSQRATNLEKASEKNGKKVLSMFDTASQKIISRKKPCMTKTTMQRSRQLQES